MDLDSRAAHADTTAPWPPMPAEESGTFRWLRPGELLAIPVPTAALQLDALLRHLEIDGEFGDWPAAAIHLAQAQSTWQRLEPVVSARTVVRKHLRGARKAARELARALDRASDAVREGRKGEVVKQARAAIAHIEAVERVFE
jgi:multidrug resistance efflux pump